MTLNEKRKPKDFTYFFYSFLTHRNSFLANFAWHSLSVAAFFSHLCNIRSVGKFFSLGRFGGAAAIFFSRRRARTDYKVIVAWITTYCQRSAIMRIRRVSQAPSILVGNSVTFLLSLLDLDLALVMQAFFMTAPCRQLLHWSMTHANFLYSL